MFKDTITTDLFKGQKEERFLISDIATHGCSGGVSGLTYYTETIAFYDKQKKKYGICSMICPKIKASQSHF